MIVSIGLSLALRYTYQFFYRRRHLAAAGRDHPVRHPPRPGLALVDRRRRAWRISDRRARRVSRTSCCAPASARRRARSPTTRASPRHPASTSTASSGSSGCSARALAGLSRHPVGVLPARRQAGTWASRSCCSIFAAVTLGGLGTAFGALVGSLIVGLFVEVSTLWLPSDLKYVGALVVLILVLLFRPQGILGRRERIG